MTTHEHDDDDPVTFAQVLLMVALSAVSWIALCHLALWIWEGLA